jgi:hypothetical protein
VAVGKAKAEAAKKFYWEIVALKVAESGVFNIAGLTPLEAVMVKRAYDVLKVYQLKII